MMQHTSKVNIRFADIDVMGHVNNAIYLNYFEQARMAWFKVLVGEDWDWKGAGILLARNEIDYMKPLLLNDNASILTTVEKMGNKSMTLTYQVYKETSKGRVDIARGLSILVCFDYTKGTTIPVPDQWRTRIENWEAN